MLRPDGGRRPLPGPGTLLRSGRCTLWLRLRGGRGVLTCEGRAPRVHAGGSVRIGRLATRGTVAAPEIGAVPGASLRIGHRVFINQGSVVVAHHEIVIADDVRIGDFCAVYDTDHHPVDEHAPVRTAPVVLGRNVWLGRNVTVLPGTRIGAHSVVAAGSVVRGEIPDRVLVAGRPAAVVRAITASDGWRRR